MSVPRVHTTHSANGIPNLGCPLENPNMDARDVVKRKPQILIEGGSKLRPFLTRGTLLLDPFRKFTGSSINGNQLTFLDKRRDTKHIAGL